MPDVCRALLDVDVILDVFQRRQPFYDDSAAVLAAAETGRLAGLVAAHSVTTLFYLLAKYGSADQARVNTLGAHQRPALVAQRLAELRPQATPFLDRPLARRPHHLSAMNRAPPRRGGALFTWTLSTSRMVSAAQRLVVGRRSRSDGRC